VANCGVITSIKLTKIRQKRVEELEKRLKNMEEQLQRANQGKEIVKVVDEREALENLWEEGISNFECRISLEGSNITELRNSRALYESSCPILS
jgi:CII-binding regulator of phage lambda lysogenization HflD